jgi:hypothetical protein
MRQRWVVTDHLEQVESGHVWQPQIEHGAVDLLFSQSFEGIVGRTNGDKVDVAMAEQLRYA